MKEEVDIILFVLMSVFFIGLAILGIYNFFFKKGNEDEHTR